MHTLISMHKRYQYMFLVIFSSCIDVNSSTAKKKVMYPLCDVSDMQIDPGVCPGVCKVDICMLSAWFSGPPLPNLNISPSLARRIHFKSTPHCLAATTASESPRITCHASRNSKEWCVAFTKFVYFIIAQKHECSCDFLYPTSIPSSTISFNPSRRISRPPTIARGSFPPVWSKCRWVKNAEETLRVDKWMTRILFLLSYIVPICLRIGPAR